MVGPTKSRFALRERPSVETGEEAATPRRFGVEMSLSNDDGSARETPKTWRDGPTGRDGRVDDVSGTSAPSNTVWGRKELWPALRHPSLALYW